VGTCLYCNSIVYDNSRGLISPASGLETWTMVALGNSSKIRVDSHSFWSNVKNDDDLAGSGDWSESMCKHPCLLPPINLSDAIPKIQVKNLRFLPINSIRTATSVFDLSIGRKFFPTSSGRKTGRLKGSKREKQSKTETSTCFNLILLLYMLCF